MGNAAGKELQATELQECTLHPEGQYALSPTLVTSSVLSNTKSKKNAMIDKDNDDKVLVDLKADGGMMSNRSILMDGEGKEVATVVQKLKGIKKEGTVYVLRSIPSHSDQEKLTEDEMKNLKIKEGTYYEFAKISVERTMTTAKAIYSVIVKKDDYKDLYVAKKLSAMNFLCIITTADEVPVGKAAMKGMSMNVSAEVSKGVDFAAAMLTMQCVLPNGGGTAGALAGAGVV